MNAQYFHKDGTLVNTGECIMPEMWEQVFVVKVRSMSPLSTNTIKGLIETRHEVTNIRESNRVCIVR